MIGLHQHLRWPLRHFDDRSTAAKFSPSKWTSRSRVSSVIFPASPSFLARTSLECESSQLLRQDHSREHFSAEAIPLCQVTQPRSEQQANFVSFNVPTINNGVREKAENRKRPIEQFKNYIPGGGKIVKLENDSTSFEKKEKINNVCSLVGNEYQFQNVLGVHRSDRNVRNSDEHDSKEYKDAHMQHNPAFLGDTGNYRLGSKEEDGEAADSVPAPAIPGSSTQREKPKRYSRSSLRKQKRRYYDDRDPEPCNNVPTSECKENPDTNFQESETERNKLPNEVKTAEMRRKTLLRKISLQDTYLNYNQDYWLDFKKSPRFHKSIDLGYFGKEEIVKVQNQRIKKKTNDKKVQVCIWPEAVHSEGAGSLDQFLIGSDPVRPESKKEALTRSDSDPLLFSKRSSPSHLRPINNNSNEEVICRFMSESEGRVGRSQSWFLFPSNENIPLFSERTGLIETDFDGFEEASLGSEDERSFIGERKVSFSGREVLNKRKNASRVEKDFYSFSSHFPDYDNFYEIKLNNSESEESDDGDVTVGNDFW